MIKSVLRFFGLVRGDIDKLVGEFSGLSSRLHNHAARAAADAQEHRNQASWHNDKASVADEEAKRAVAIATNINTLLAV